MNYPQIAKMRKHRPVTSKFRNKLINQIEKVTILEYGLSIKDLNTRTRLQHFVYIRQSIMVILRDNSNLSLGTIGALFNLDHATVLHSMKCVKKAKDGYNTELLNVYETILKGVEI